MRLRRDRECLGGLRRQQRDRLHVERFGHFLHGVERGRRVGIQQSPEVRAADARAISNMREGEPAFSSDFPQPARKDDSQGRPFHDGERRRCTAW